MARSDRAREQQFPTKTLDPPLGFLPLQSTPFVGRDKERMLLGALLRRSDVRLITLTGPGGAGKTRLALQIARDLHETLADGVVFVALASVSDPTSSFRLSQTRWESLIQDPCRL